ncbi:MAG: hypothetical protein AAFP20_12100 [Cyanobacteria bacterium J06614_10]
MTASRHMERYFKMSAYALLIAALMIAVIAFFVSPLRDPNFVPAAANAGATVSWLTPERYWRAGLNILAIALATNVVVLRWLSVRSSRTPTHTSRNLLHRLFQFISLCGLWLGVFYGTWFVSMYYLLWQYILD